MGWAEKAIEAIKERGGKVTPQRLKIVKVIEELGPKHPSLKEVLEKVRREFPTVSFSTLYNNVLILKEAGLLYIFYHDGEARIEVNTLPHINIVSDGEIVDLLDPNVIAVIEEKLRKKVLFVNAYTAKD